MTANDAFNISIENLHSQIEWLDESSQSKTINLKKSLLNDGFVLANLDVAGFYRVNYDELSWNNIIKQLKNLKDVQYYLV